MANANIIAQKEQIVSELTESIRNAAAGVIVNYQGITVEDDTKLRKDLRNAGVEYKVVKNTLTAKACDALGYDKLKEVLNGMTALAISKEDPVAAAKIICEYAEKHENYTVKAGFVEGELLDTAGVKALAAIPSKETLIAKMLGSLQSSLYNLAYALQAIIDKDGKGAEEAPAEAAAPANE